MTDAQIAEIMGWPKRYGPPPMQLARVKAVIEAAQKEEREACCRMAVRNGGLREWIVAEKIKNMTKEVELEVTDIQGEFSVRVFNVLEASDITSFAELCKRQEIDLVRLPNFGRAALQEVREALKRKGLPLMTPYSWPKK